MTRFRSRATAAASMLAAAGAMVALTGAAALPAPGHVHVEGDAEVGTSATVTFRVPNESDSASTVRIEVELPSDTPFTTVRTQSKPGWVSEIVWSDLETPIAIGDAQVERYVSSIVWSTTGEGIAPGEFDLFVATMGPVPDRSEVALPTLQTYSDGWTQEWVEVEVPGAHHADLARPAPVLSIGESQLARDDAISFWVGMSAVGLGVASLVIGVIALSRTLSPTRTH